MKKSKDAVVLSDTEEDNEDEDEDDSLEGENLWFWSKKTEESAKPAEAKP